MKTSLKLSLCLFLLGSAFATVNVNGADSEASSSEESNCPGNVDEAVNRVKACIKPRNEFDFTSAETIRYFVKSYCYNLQPVRQCLRDVFDGAKKCFNAEIRSGFVLIKEFVEVVLDVGCSQYGEKISKIVDDIREISNDRESQRKVKALFENCVDESSLEKLNSPTETNPGQFARQIFKALKSFKYCFVSDSRDLIRTTMDIDELLSELLEKMKCHDSSGNLLLCKELERHCPMTGNYTSGDFLLRGLNCFSTNFTKHYRQKMTSIEKARAYMKEYCDTRMIVSHCTNEMASDADQCFNDRATREGFKVYRKDLEIVLDVMCSNNGRKVARIITELESLGDNTEFRRNFEDCLGPPPREEHLSSDTSLRENLFFGYSKVKDKRECIFETLRTEITSINEFADLSREFLGRCQCLHPEEDTTINCNYLTKDGTSKLECPTFQSYEHERQYRQYLFDKAFKCISVKNIHFEHLTNETSPDEMRAFIRDYCQHLPVAGDCLSDVATEAEVCLGPPPHRIFQLLKQMMETAVETGCTQDGKRLATVFADLKEGGGDGGGAGECIDINVMKIKLVPGREPEEHVRIYRETESFQECVVETGGGAVSVGNLTEVFLADVLRELNCREKQSGGEGAVLCNHVSIDSPDSDEEN